MDAAARTYDPVRQIQTVGFDLFILVSSRVEAFGAVREDSVVHKYRNMITMN